MPAILRLNAAPGIETFLFQDDGETPNSRLPVVLYRKALRFATRDLAAIKDALAKWVKPRTWHLDWLEEDAVLKYTHYHTTAFEMLVIIEGASVIRLGGVSGREITVSGGDALAIPPGVGHRRLDEPNKLFTVAGLYPENNFKWDLFQPKRRNYEQAIHNIASVGLPKADPLYGNIGALLEFWK